MAINTDSFNAWWKTLSGKQRNDAKVAVRHTERALPEWIVHDLKRDVTYVHLAEWVGDPDSAEWRPSSALRTLISTADD